jgi:transposase
MRLFAICDNSRLIQRAEDAMQKAKLTDANGAVLQAALRGCLHDSREARFAQRLQCVTLISLGFGCEQVARWFGLTARTLERWIDAYRIRGVNGLKDSAKQGRPSLLDERELDAIRGDLAKNPAEFGYDATTWCAALLNRHIRSRWGVELSERQAQRLFRRLKKELAGNLSASESAESFPTFVLTPDGLKGGGLDADRDWPCRVCQKIQDYWTNTGERLA